MRLVRWVGRGARQGDHNAWEVLSVPLEGVKLRDTHGGGRKLGLMALEGNAYSSVGRVD